MGVSAPTMAMASLEGGGRGSSLEKIMCTCRHCKGVVLQTRSRVASHLGNHGPYRPRTTKVSFDYFDLPMWLFVLYMFAFIINHLIHLQCGLFFNRLPT
jgi:hypothetical protein